MIVSTILLSKDDYYVDSEGNLPSRGCVEFDKNLLKALVSGKSVSYKSIKMLPPSIAEVAKVTAEEPEVGITIREIDALSDLLIVTRSCADISEGKTFNLNKSFKPLVKDTKIEIWIRK